MTEQAVEVNLRSRLMLRLFRLKPEDVTLPPFRKVSIPPDGYFYKRVELVQCDDKISIREVTRSHRSDSEIASEEIARVSIKTPMTKVLIAAAIHQARLDKRTADRWRDVQAAQQKRNRERRLL